MRFIFVLFLILFLAIIFGGHYLVYYSIIKFFNVTSQPTKLTLLITAVLLSFTLIFSMTLARVSDFFVLRWFYILVTNWHGVLVNLFLASVLTWFIFWLTNLLKMNLNTKILLFGLFILAAIISIYGIWNAQHPQLKNISVKIKNLPAAWQNKKIAFISDVHLGAVNRKPFIEKVVEQINQTNPEMVLIGGDYFDGSTADYDDFVSPLKSLLTKKIFFVNGNHESYVGEQSSDQVLQSAGVKILKNEIIAVDGLNILGVDYTDDLGNKKGFEELLAKVNSNETNILLYHEPRYTDLAKAKGIDLQLAGHVHFGQQYPFNFITQIIYGKYYYGLNTDGDYNSYTSNGVGTWGPAMRIGNTPEIVIITLDSKS